MSKRERQMNWGKLERAFKSAGSSKRKSRKSSILLNDDKKRRDGGMIYSIGYEKYRDRQLGKMGAASKVRLIDPATVDLSKYQ
jgi:hypothetical protein